MYRYLPSLEGNQDKKNAVPISSCPRQQRKRRTSNRLSNESHFYKLNIQSPTAVVVSRACSPSAMKIAVLGATGGTGVEFVKEALACQHEVVAIVRTPAKLKIQHEKLTVVEGNIFSEENLAGHFKGCECVVSCLGFSRTSVVTGYTNSIKPIVAAMRTEKVRRLVAMTAYYSDIASSESRGCLVRWLLIPMLRPILMNMREMEVYLDTNCSDIDYTVVRPPGLGRGASSGKEVKSEIGAYFLEHNTRMPRVDVAKFMVQCLPEQQFFKKAVAIGL